MRQTATKSGLSNFCANRRSQLESDLPVRKYVVSSPQCDAEDQHLRTTILQAGCCNQNTLGLALTIGVVLAFASAWDTTFISLLAGRKKAFAIRGFLTRN